VEKSFIFPSFPDHADERAALRSDRLFLHDPTSTLEMEDTHKQLPVIVLDGQNVCMQHKDNAVDKLKGLRIALMYFIERGYSKEHLIVVFPRQGWQRRLKKQALQLQATFIYTPAGGHKEDDDIFALTIARQHDALLLTTDRFRNHLDRWTKDFGYEEGDKLRVWCCAHLLPFVFGGDMLYPHFEVLMKAMATSSSMIIQCYRCKTPLGKAEDILSNNDPAGIYDPDEEVNPAGFCFCFSKFRKVSNTQEFWHDHFLTVSSSESGSREVVVRQESPPRMKDTWYPDYYSWCLLFCSACESGLGWHFRLERSRTQRQPLFDLLPPEFYGLRHEAIVMCEHDANIIPAPPGFEKKLC